MYTTYQPAGRQAGWQAGGSAGRRAGTQAGRKAAYAHRLVHDGDEHLCMPQRAVQHSVQQPRLLVPELKQQGVHAVCSHKLARA